jgi:hypothetical protein
LLLDLADFFCPQVGKENKNIPIKAQEKILESIIFFQYKRKRYDFGFENQFFSVQTSFFSKF